MRNAFVSLVVAALGGYAYMNHPQLTATSHSVASTLPEGHHHAPEGVYYLRTAYAVPTQNGPVQWSSGQTLYEDRRVLTPQNSGMVTVTDGTHTTQLLASMLSQDVEEGVSLHAANTAADMNARALTEQERIRSQMQSRIATPAASYVSPLEQSARPVGTVYYNPGYSSVVVREERNSLTSGSQVHEHPRPVVVPPRQIIVTH